MQKEKKVVERREEDSNIAIFKEMDKMHDAIDGVETNPNVSIVDEQKIIIEDNLIDFSKKVNDLMSLGYTTYIGPSILGDTIERIMCVLERSAGTTSQTEQMIMEKAELVAGLVNISLGNGEYKIYYSPDTITLNNDTKIFVILKKEV